MKKEEIDMLISLMEHGNWDTAMQVSDKLGKCTDSYCVTGLIRLLESSSGDVRNAAALALREIGNSVAVKPLLDAIGNPENLSNRSTMVYALETLDCGRYFADIFKLALASKFDVRLSALNILHDQGFWISDDDIEKARKELADYGKVYPDDSVIQILHELLNSLASDES